MTWGYVALGVGTVAAAYITSESASNSADKASEAAILASRTEAGAQNEALDYLKSVEKTPQALREESLKRLGGLSGLPGGEGDQQQLIDRAIQSPLYQGIMGGKEAGEDAILRSASATGGLRSGDTSYNLYDYNVKLQNEALLQSYNQQLMGLQGLAGLPSNANQIAGGISNVGATMGQGIVGAAQSQQTGQQQMWNNIMGIGQLGVSAYSASQTSNRSLTPSGSGANNMSRGYTDTGPDPYGMYSDRRLKTNIKKIGTIKGFNFYSFDWNMVANKMGLKGSTFGCMADEVFKFIPEAVTLRHNFMFINYSTIGVL